MSTRSSRKPATAGHHAPRQEARAPATMEVRWPSKRTMASEALAMHPASLRPPEIPGRRRGLEMTAPSITERVPLKTVAFTIAGACGLRWLWLHW